MSDLYLVWIWDGYNDSSAHLQIIFDNRDDAINYASFTYLPHNGKVWVTGEKIGTPCPSRACRPNALYYEREHYDPQKALWDEARWFYLEGMSKEQFIRLIVSNYSPMCVDTDWDLLYERCVEFYE